MNRDNAKKKNVLFMVPFLIVSSLFFLLFSPIIFGQEQEGNMTISDAGNETTAANTTTISEGNETQNNETTEGNQSTDNNQATEGGNFTDVTEETNTTNTSDTTNTTGAANITNETNTSAENTENATETIVTAIEIEKITPATIAKGVEQLNILVRNTGTGALEEIEAEVTGYGITTVEKLSIEVLLAGEKDYTFTKIVAESAGTEDIIVKIYANETMLFQDIFQLTVTEEQIEEVQENVVNVSESIIMFNVTAAEQEINETRGKYEELEKEYLEKQKAEYVVFGIEEDLKQIKEYLRKAQVALIEEDQEEFATNIAVAKTNIETVGDELARAEKENKTVLELLSENIALIGSLFGVIISGVTVWSITKVHLKRAKIVNIIKGKQILNVGKETNVENIIEDEEKGTKDL